MALRVTSLSEDNVDAYTHIWSVAFFLILSFSLLFVPENQSETQAKVQWPQSSFPTYEAKCWCPAQFEDAHVAYTNNVCSKAYNWNIRGKKFPHVKVFNMITEKPMGPKKDDNDNNNSSSSDRDQSEETSSSAGMPLPVVLFLLAIALRLPRMLCGIVSRCCGCVNIGQTLESTEKGDAMDGDNRRRVYAGLVKAFNDYARTSEKRTTYLYLIMKVLVISVLIAEIIVIKAHVLPQLQETGHKADDSSTMEGEAASPLSDRKGLNPAKVLKFQDSQIFVCSFFIKRLNDKYNHMVQCSLTQTLQTTEVGSSTMSNVFLIVLANLIIMLVVHALNTLLWVVSLASESTRDRLGLGKNSPLDLVFLIQMARSNLGIGVAAGLVEAIHCDESKGDREEGLIFKNA